MRWAQHVACIEEDEGVEGLVWKTKEEVPL
jgi:hypothetical protein